MNNNIIKEDGVGAISVFMTIQVILIGLRITGAIEGLPLIGIFLPTIILCGFFLIICLFVLIVPLAERMIDWVLERL